jgi:hypothetical protein
VFSSWEPVEELWMKSLEATIGHNNRLRSELDNANIVSNYNLFLLVIISRYLNFKFPHSCYEFTILHELDAKDLVHGVVNLFLLRTVN